jgi:hypothetical protein
MMFNNPIPVRQVIIDSGGTTLPLHEVKDRGIRHLIINFSGEMANVVIQVNVEN